MVALGAIFTVYSRFKRRLHEQDSPYSSHPSVQLWCLENQLGNGTVGHTCLNELTSIPIHRRQRMAVLIPIIFAFKGIPNLLIDLCIKYCKVTKKHPLSDSALVNRICRGPRTDDGWVASKWDVWPEMSERLCCLKSTVERGKKKAATDVWLHKNAYLEEK